MYFSLDQDIDYKKSDSLRIAFLFIMDCIIIDEAHRGYNLDKEIDEGDLHFKDEK